MRTGLLFIVCFLSGLTFFGQSYSFKNYTTHDGLVQTDITDIRQDKRGNIWIGTNGGLSVFDGKKFTNYDDHDVLQSLRINALLCDSFGVMWIATQNGLLKYANGFEVFFKPSPAHNNPVTCLTTNSQNILLFVCNKMVYQVIGNAVSIYRINNIIEKEMAFVSFDRDDNLWMVTTDLRVYKKSFNSVTPIRTAFTPEQKNRGLGMVKILGKEGPTPYFVTNFGTYWVRDDSLCYFMKQYPQFGKAGVGYATYVLEDNDSTVWAGGTVGMAKLSGTSATRFVKNNGFCDNSVSCLFMDREHNLWIGCTYNGVYKLSNEALFHLKSSDESFNLQHVSDIAPLSLGQTLLATWGKGLYLLTCDSVTRIRFPKPDINYITGLLPAGEQTYISWFGSGLWRMDNKTFGISLVRDFCRDEAIYRMYKVAGGFLFHTLNESLYLTDNNLKIKAAVKQPENYTITVLNDKIYQLSPFGEVSVLDDNLKAIRKNLFPDISSRITQLVCYHDNILAGTFGQGLFVYNQWGKLIKKIDKKSGLHTNIVTGLLADGAHLFIGTNYGLARTDLPDLQTVKNFNENEGLFNWECRENGLKKLPDGSVLIATTNGPYIYYSNKDLTTQYTSGILTVADFRYGDKPEKHFNFSAVSSNMQVPETIAYKDNAITITLNGVSQRNPDDIIYHYQLLGYDSMWVGIANPVIAFSNLDPGDYKLRAYLTTGNFTSKLVTVRFSIAKPFSGELWFQAVLIFFLSAFCWLLLTVGNRIYQKYIQTRMVGKLEAEVAQKRRLTAQSVAFAQQHHTELRQAVKATAGSAPADDLIPLFFKAVGKRIELLWKQDAITLGAFHRHFDELLAEQATGAKLYHTFSVEEIEMPMPAAFHLLQVFTLYLFTGLHEDSTAVFSLDSEVKSNGQVLLRFYTVTHVAPGAKAFTYHFLKEAIDGQSHNSVTIDIIENLELGNMMIAELNLHNET